MVATQTYPARVDASLDAPLSRWLWLFKWLLLIPHYIVLAFMWLAFIVLSAVAMVAIVATGRYPRAIFEFNVGVLRWTWRVQFYAIGAFGTDRYPPFTLADVPSYPAHLAIDYPERLSRGLALVKWWLLAIPQYVIIGVFTGSGLWAASQPGDQGWNVAGLGLIGLLTVIAGVVLLITGRYPEQIFDFVLGLNRWVLRVAAYAALMTDRYPPFRLDQGGHDPGTVRLPADPAPPVPAGPEPSAPVTGETGRASRSAGWTAGRIVSVVLGALLVLLSAGLLGAGGSALWAQTQKQGGYVDLGTTTYRAPGYALVSDPLHLHARSGGWDGATALAGTARIRVSQATGHLPVFIGIAPARAVHHYLDGVGYSTVRGTGHRGDYVRHRGSAPAVPPARAGIWTARAAGPGIQILTWAVKSGDWTVVVMNADATRPVTIRAGLAATLPVLPELAAGLLITGFVLLGGGILLIAVPLSRKGVVGHEH